MHTLYNMQVPQWNVATDVIEDYDAGLEYGEAAKILKSVQKGDAREYLVQWSDDYPDTWEPEDHLPQHLIEDWEERQRQRLLASMQSAPQNSKHGSGRSRVPQTKPPDAPKATAVQPV
jgi:signal recognition particle protein